MSLSLQLQTVILIVLTGTSLFPSKLAAQQNDRDASTARLPAKPDARIDSNYVDTSLTPAIFDARAADALVAMRARADALKVGGVAVLAFCPGEKVDSWISRMLVIGRLKDEPTANSKGSNLLAIVYTKAAEMADTLRNSGSQVRPPMTGEFGWEGGVIFRLNNGYLIAAFSGGASADDVAIARAGVAAVLARANPAH